MSSAENPNHSKIENSNHEDRIPTPEERVLELGECARLLKKPFKYAHGNWDHYFKILPHHPNERVLEKLKETESLAQECKINVETTIVQDPTANVVPDLVDGQHNQRIRRFEK